MPKATTVVIVIALVLFGSSTHAADFKIPPDSTLEQWMKQPVEETLKGTGVVYVNDGNYQREVFGAGKPVMVLFYGLSDGCQGLGALVKVLHQRFPSIKVCAYRDPGGKTISRAEFDELARKYGLKDAPALLFYKHEGPRAMNLGSDVDLYKGIIKLETLIREIEWYSKNLQGYLLK